MKSCFERVSWNILFQNFQNQIFQLYWNIFLPFFPLNMTFFVKIDRFLQEVSTLRKQNFHWKTILLHLLFLFRFLFLFLQPALCIPQLDDRLVLLKLIGPLSGQVHMKCHIAIVTSYGGSAHCYGNITLAGTNCDANTMLL